MFCASCAEETAGAPCATCGADPLLEGRYRLDQRLGHGATGITWRATRLSDGEPVAIKAVSLPPGLGTKERELVGREVDVLRQLDHPAIPTLYDAFVVRAGGGVRLQYLVQQFVPGRTLADELAEHRFDELGVLAVLDEVAQILEYLHRLSPPVVHRDLKPGNLMRRPGDPPEGGKLVLIDFGAVKDALSDPHLGGSTVAGTFGFMAPEQLRGDASPRSDLYALGAIAVALLTREEPRVLLDHRGGSQWRARCRVSEPTARLVDHLLAAEPADRPASASAVRQLVAELFAHRAPDERPIDTPLPPVLPREPPETGNTFPLGVAALALVCAVAAVVLFGTVGGSREAAVSAPAVPQCGAGPCVAIAEFALRGLRLGQTVDEARAAFPELASAEVVPAEAVGSWSTATSTPLPGTRLKVRTVVADTLAACELSFAVSDRLSHLDCEADALDEVAHRDAARRLEVALEARHGPPHAPSAAPEFMGWTRTTTWSDPTGELRLYSQFMKVGETALGSELSLDVRTRDHDRLVDEIVAEATRAAKAAASEQRRLAEEVRRREIEALQQAGGTKDGGL